MKTSLSEPLLDSIGGIRVYSVDSVDMYFVESQHYSNGLQVRFIRWQV